VEIVSVPKLELIHRLTKPCESCYFGPSGLFWTCSRRDNETAVLEVWNTSTWTAMAHQTLSDPFGASHIDLLPHFETDRVVVWFAAGQDGQRLFWARHHGESITTEPFPELNDTAWPAFSPSRDEFLTISGNELHCYEYPKGPLVAKMTWPENDGEDSIGYGVSYLDENRALLSSTNGRLFVVNLDAMTLTDELQIQGHELRPNSQLYPQLRDFAGVGGDLFLFFPYSNRSFLSVHQMLPCSDPDTRRDQLVIWNAGDL